MSLLSTSNDEHARKVSAWTKAKIVLGYDPNIYRQDRFGWWIAWAQYGTLGE